MCHNNCLRKEGPVNVRKPIDYSAIFRPPDALMVATLLQLELYCEIEKLASARPKKDAAGHLTKTYPDASGFSSQKSSTDAEVLPRL